MRNHTVVMKGIRAERSASRLHSRLRSKRATSFSSSTATVLPPAATLAGILFLLVACAHGAEFASVDLMKSHFMETEIPPPSVNLFNRDLIVLGSSNGAASLYTKESQRGAMGTNSNVGTLRFTTNAIAQIGPKGYAFSVTPSEISVHAHGEEGFSQAVSEMISSAYQDSGLLPEGLFVNTNGPVFAYRSFDQPFHDLLAQDLSMFYEVGRLASILGYNHLSVGIEMAIMDLSEFSLEEYPGKVIFAAPAQGPSLSQVRSVFVSLKEDYPINVDPVMQIAKLGDDFIGVKEEYTVDLVRGTKRSCYDITIPELPELMASLVELACMTAAMDVDNVSGQKGDTCFLGTDEPYVVLVDHLDLPAGPTYAEYVNAVIAECETRVSGVTFYGWHDAFYSDPLGKIKPSNGRAGWPEWLYRNNLIAGERGPFEEGREYLNKDSFHPAIWIYEEYSVSEYQSVIELFLTEGFTTPLCLVWGDTQGPKTNILNFGKAAEESSCHGFVQTSFTSPNAHSQLIVMGSLVARYGAQEWMRSITDEQLYTFSSNLGFGVTLYPIIEGMQVSNDVVSLIVQGVDGSYVGLERCISLCQPDWQPVGEAVPTTGEPVLLIDTNAPQPAAFYRAKQTPVP